MPLSLFLDFLPDFLDLLLDFDIPKGQKGDTGVSGGMLFPTMDFDPSNGILTIRGLEQEVRRINYDYETAELVITF